MNLINDIITCFERMFHNYFITRVRMINDECQDMYEEIRIKVPGKAYCAVV